MYRLSYGNGQVSEAFSTYEEARAVYAAQVRFDRDCRVSSHGLRITWYAGDGEWVGIGARSRPEVP